VTVFILFRRYINPFAASDEIDFGDSIVDVYAVKDKAHQDMTALAGRNRHPDVSYFLVEHEVSQGPTP